jgi:hypothetical protein
MQKKSYMHLNDKISFNQDNMPKELNGIHLSQVIRIKSNNNSNNSWQLSLDTKAIVKFQSQGPWNLQIKLYGNNICFMSK